jgi:hypothetical protein
VRNGRAVGAALIGVGAAAGVGILLLTRKASAASLGSPRERSFEPSPSVPVPEVPRAPRAAFLPLVERWRGEVARRSAGTGLPVDALLAWIQIESRGDTCSGSGTRELGIWQLYFPDDAKYGATPEVLAAICAKSQRPGFSILQLSEAELDAEVGAGIRKVVAARDAVRRVFAQNGVTWPETSFDFGSAVKQIHAAPAVITELVPKITRRLGSSPASWVDLRVSVSAFPIDQMGTGLVALRKTPSRHGLANRLEDTMQNAEFVGRAWGASARGDAFV